MITGNQAARLHAAQTLYEAREKVNSVRSSVIFTTPENVRAITSINELIDGLFEIAIPKNFKEHQ